MIENIDFNLDKNILKEIIEISEKHSSIKRVVLFGSRVRKDNYPKSDIDLAVYLDGNFSNLLDFIYDIENNTTTLLEFDFSNMNEIKDELFIKQVEQEGITIYEKH